MSGLWSEEIPAEVAEAGRDAVVVDQLAAVFRRNCRNADGLVRQITDAEAHELAERTMAVLLDPDGLQMADVGGLRFYLQIDSELYPCPNLILANAWDGVQWRPVAEIRLPGGSPADGEA
ncbi:MAG TPA: hypothetical protein VNM16_01760 [Bacillota bacterium]|nr:hypothetical protein [Bacillota bacterium]